MFRINKHWVVQGRDRLNTIILFPAGLGSALKTVFSNLVEKCFTINTQFVITSYSIHYTKLYEIIGSALASNLKLKTGDKVTIMSMTASRGTNAMTLEITGIAVLPVAALNASNFWMPLDRVQHFLQTPGAVQQILIKTSGGVKSKDAAAALSDRFSADGTPVDVKEMKDGSTT